MLRRRYFSIFAAGFALAILSACSASKKTEGEEDPNAPPPLDDVAQTDSVPPPDSLPPESSEAPSTASLDGEPPATLGDAPTSLESSEPSAVAAVPPAPEEQKPQEYTQEEIAAAPSAPQYEPLSASASPSLSASSALSGETEQYTVTGDDTLMKIAFETYGDLYQWKRIYQDNKDKISDPNNVPRGTVLVLSKPETAVVIERNGLKYLIKRGDTLGLISSDVYGTPRKWKRLWENNRQLIQDPNKIYAGFFLYYTITDEDKQEMKNIPDSVAQGAGEREPGSYTGNLPSTGPGSIQAQGPEAVSPDQPRPFPKFKR